MSNAFTSKLKFYAGALGSSIFGLTFLSDAGNNSHTKHWFGRMLLTFDVIGDVNFVYVYECFIKNLHYECM